MLVRDAASGQMTRLGHSLNRKRDECMAVLRAEPLRLGRLTYCLEGTRDSHRPRGESSAEGQDMQKDRDELRSLNIEIGEAESTGDAQFLEGVKQGPERLTEIESMDILGTSRAIVTCLVTLKVVPTPSPFHNARLFVRDRDGRWKLLGWANEGTNGEPGTR